MVYLSLAFCFSLMTSAMAEDFIVTPLENDVDLSALDKSVKIRSAKTPYRTTYLSFEERDQIFEKHIPKQLKALDQDERDLIYKSFLNYDEATLAQKYPQFSPATIKKLKNAFN